MYARADFIAENEDVIAEWAELGLHAVFIGLEAATNTELDSMNKESTVDYNRAAVAMLKKYKVDTYGSLIPNPDYTKEDWKRLWDFIEETGLYYVNISPLTPLAGYSYLGFVQRPGFSTERGAWAVGSFACSAPY